MFNSSFSLKTYTVYKFGLHNVVIDTCTFLRNFMMNHLSIHNFFFKKKKERGIEEDDKIINCINLNFFKLLANHNIVLVHIGN